MCTLQGKVPLTYHVLITPYTHAIFQHTAAATHCA